MKERNWGISDKVYFPWNARYAFYSEPQNRIDIIIVFKACNQSICSYKTNRENGQKVDEPNYAFPNDGTYDIQKDDGIAGMDSKIRYIEGVKDRQWMEIKDYRYLKRIAHTGTTEETEQLAREIQQLTTNDITGRRKKESYAEFFAAEVKKFEEEKTMMEAKRKKEDEHIINTTKNFIDNQLYEFEFLLKEQKTQFQQQLREQQEAFQSQFNALAGQIKSSQKNLEDNLLERQTNLEQKLVDQFNQNHQQLTP